MLFFIGFGSELDDLVTKSSDVDGKTYLKIGCEKLKYWPCCYQIGLIYKISKKCSARPKKVKYYYKKVCRFGSKLAYNSLMGL
ncbi:hypothetical protein CPIN17260_0050 [Campylobacter pinnipediorum subsp. pinnipediorum]|uniref:hypothetical protein n=1 Tax=Campylobacter pinnipediorum TaxID=1965231 RepID=UPI000994E2EB|nr:hypothetical protein [Campylobacter pinnipediorum]AQW80409.1 hypothetical protein CPIN17260_0050 [Campylobacter pinnipediorum subsp. pinnipediorum]